MQQLKAPCCFCCALALLSVSFFKAIRFLLFVGVWMLLLGRNCGFYRWLGDVPPTLTSLCSSVQGPDTGPDQTPQHRSWAGEWWLPSPDCSHTALNFKCDGCWRNLPATLLSAKPKAFHLARNSRLKENGVWRFRWPLDLKGSCIILYSKSRVSWAPVFHQGAHDSPVMSSVGSSVRHLKVMS